MSAVADQTTQGEIIEGTAVEISHPPAIVPPTVPQFAVTPSVQAAELVARLDVIKQAMSTAMVDGVDYGRIPGTEKPTLLKPGAEKLAVLFQFDVQTTHDERWGPADHLTVVAHSTVFHIPSGARVGGGEGLCATREKKYGKRQQQRTCPGCGGSTLFKSKRDPEFFCWAKKGGCGATFPEDDARITAQSVGEIDNPEMADTWNTVLKMARKRALVDAILLTTGASAIFTQDAEDLPRTEADPPPPPARAPEPQLLPDGSVMEVLAAISKASMGTDWVRAQLVAVGAQDVPQGSLTKGTIQKLTAEQAIAIVQACDKAAEAKAAQS